MASNRPGSPDHSLSFAPIWADTLGFVQRHGELLWPLAAAFLFLPQLLVVIATPEQAGNATPEFGRALLFLGLFAASIVATLLAQLTIAFLAMNDGTAGLTLGQVVGRSARLLLPALAVVLIQGIAILVGLLLFIVPGFWILARLSVALPVVANGPHDPLEALKESWRLTNGHALRILGLLSILTLGILLIVLGILSIGLAVGAVSTMAAGTPADGWGLGRWIFEVISAAAVAVLGVVSMGFYTSLLKALRARFRAIG